MIKKVVFYTSILLTVAIISSGFKTHNSHINQWFKMGENQDLVFIYPSKNSSDYTLYQIPYLGKFFVGFKEAIAFKESQGKYNKINTLGYLGKYQFGKETLESIGIKDSARFMNSPKLQEKAFVTLLSKNKYELQEIINKYQGKMIDGVKITESGILAAAHLGGKGSVIRFLKSNGSKKCKDAYGTSVRNYLRDFGGFETQKIPPIKKAKVD
jgi:hypothetical protein